MCVHKQDLASNNHMPLNIKTETDLHKIDVYASLYVK